MTKKMTKKILIIGAILMSTIYLSSCSKAQPKTGVLRLHVIANSDGAFDQSVKLKVKDKVSTIMAEKRITNYDDAMDIAVNNMEEIEQIVNDVLRENGADYGSTTEVGTYHFPEKTYGKAVFKEGYYNAVKIKLGEANGENWWCVMFPPICFIDSGNTWDLSSEENVEFKSLLADFIKE